MAAFFTGIAISMYCPSMMTSLGNGTFLDSLSGQGLTASSANDWDTRAVAGLPRGGPLGWTRGTSQPHPRPGRRTRRPGHRRQLPHRTRPDRRRRQARRTHLPLGDDGRVRRAGRRRHLHRHRRRQHPQRHPQRARHRRVGIRRVHRHSADRSGRTQRSGRRRRLPLLQHRRGPAPLRRPGRRRGLPVLAVRNRRRQADVRVLRSARPQGHVRRHGHRAAHWEVISNGATVTPTTTATASGTPSSSRRG